MCVAALFLSNEVLPGWQGIDSRDIDRPGKIDPIHSPYEEITPATCSDNESTADEKRIADDVTKNAQPIQIADYLNKTWDKKAKPWETTYINLPTFEQVKDNKILYAHASRIFHQEVNPTSAKPLVQSHGSRLIWLNPPAKPLSTEEMDGVFDLEYNSAPP
jgi:hypothetical protein